MALHHVLQRGIDALLEETREPLDEWVTSRGMEPEVAEHLRQAMEAMPGLLTAIDGALYASDAPVHARRLFNTAVRYLLLEEDLVPAREDDTDPARAVVGFLDDLYLLHRTAQELREHIQSVDFRSVDGGVELLASVLAPDVVRALDDHLASISSNLSE